MVEQNVACKIVCVEREESRVFFMGVEHKPHTILGIAPGILVQFLKELASDHIGEFVCASSAEAVNWVT